MYVETYRPQATVVFQTETGSLVARATGDPKSPMDNDVLSISTSRDLQSDSPTFNITLVNRKPWHKWIASNDLVVIKMCRPPEALSTVLIGLVDDCRKKTVVSDNSVQRVITVTGRSLAKAFIRFDVGVVPEAEYQSTTTGWLENSGVILAGSQPGDIILAIWQKICKPHINYKWDKGSNLFDWVMPVINDREDLHLLDSSSIMNWQGSIHALFKSVAEEPFYEVFWETEDGYEKFKVRPTPFNPNRWNTLPVTTITDKDIVTDEIGKSDVETYTIFSVGAKSLFSPEDTYKTFGVLPYWYKPYADKYGNNRLHVETSYTSVAESSDVPLQTDTMRGLMVDLYNWNIKNNSMSNGTLILKGNNYKVGTRLIVNSTEDSSKMEYYITSVTQDFVNFSRWVTSVGVTRGLPPEERFTPPWGSYTEYSGMGIIPFNPMAARDAMNVSSVPSGSIDFVASSGVVGGAKDIMQHGIKGVFVKYTFGGRDPFAGRLDCSSFTQYVYKTYGGIDIGGTTGQQVLKGSQISKGDLKPGDLVLFKATYNSPHIYGVSHVGIYIGDGKFIDNNEGHNVGISNLSDNYWVQHWLMARRVLTDTPAVTGTGGGATFSATAYGAYEVNGGNGHWKTATGVRPVEGRTIAVDKKVIPLYSKVHIESDYPGITGDYIAEDVGGAIKGNRIDIFFNDIDPIPAHARMLKFGKRDIKVTILRSGKG